MQTQKYQGAPEVLFLRTFFLKARLSEYNFTVF